MPVPTLSIGLAGLGRMGKRHAEHFLHKIPRSTLVAISTPDADERAWAQERYGPYDIAIYAEYEDMLRHPGLQAVVIASATVVHAEQVAKAIEREGGGVHVLCEKPLSLSVEVPHLKIMCGFSRRFDASYRDAHAKMSAGLIGRAAVFRSQTCDKRDTSGAFVKYAEHSGGIFVDCAVHDVDLALWFFGADGSCHAEREGSYNTATAGDGGGGREREGERERERERGREGREGREKWKDADNAVGIVEFWDHRIAYFYASRMMAAGQEDTTEIIGTHGKLTVNANPASNLVSIHEGAASSSPMSAIAGGGGGGGGGMSSAVRGGGIRREVPSDYFQRFEGAFLQEGKEWVEACLDDKEVPVNLEGAVEAVRVAGALQEALRTGEKVRFGRDGKRVGGGEGEGEGRKEVARL
ncbi:uncharacterized protein KY384_002946 [Bacidia gigantensis]|uniref:uncharacterized protein n=1 Tax=Bacidia gigantensis TaxID=2732470 RepID=UPI001D0581BF|nr:uncharacterized protein KY384_002946 [Bacidia gigantensis]KAG8531317.1 hypothetical protein KY384_002946 [Bacidia gigantensis]